MQLTCAPSSVVNSSPQSTWGQQGDHVVWIIWSAQSWQRRCPQLGCTGFRSRFWQLGHCRSFKDSLFLHRNNIISHVSTAAMSTSSFTILDSIRRDLPDEYFIAILNSTCRWCARGWPTPHVTVAPTPSSNKPEIRRSLLIIFNNNYSI